MQAFFVRVITDVLKVMLTGNPQATNEEVQAAMKGFIRAAVHEGIGAIPEQLDRIEQQAVDRIDAMDGKMGNLQQQLTAIPGQIIGDIVVELQKLNPFNFGR
jgi:hypothetical protein